MLFFWFIYPKIFTLFNQSSVSYYSSLACCVSDHVIEIEAVWLTKQQKKKLCTLLN